MPTPTTSHAKTVKLSTDRESALDNHGVVTSHFEHARDPLISKQHYDLVRDEKAFQERQARGSLLTRDDARLPIYKSSPAFNSTALKPQTQRVAGSKVFNAAALDKGPSQAEQDSGSSMVKDDAPKPEYRPPEEMARAQNAITHFEKLVDDREKADSRQEAAIEKYKQRSRYVPDEYDDAQDNDQSGGYGR